MGVDAAVADAITGGSASGVGSVEDVYRAHGDRLWRAVLAFSRDPELASDAVAEAFAQALARESAIRSPLPWIWRAAFRIAAGSLKGRHLPLQTVPEGSYALAESDDQLLDALARLPERQRAALVLRYYADLPIREIAAVLGTNAPLVRVELMRGRRRLRLLLGGHDD
jgi:RNA polymerase sigma-70 factor, ECF subfamily